jgi:hypothetical protein
VMLALSQREEKEKERKLERETHLGDGQ